MFYKWLGVVGREEEGAFIAVRWPRLILSVYHLVGWSRFCRLECEVCLSFMLTLTLEASYDNVLR